MLKKPKKETEPDQPLVYQIRIKGLLSDQWQGWFGSLTILEEENGDTLLTVKIDDQAALFGFLRKVRDLGMQLVSLNLVEPGKPEISSTSKK